MIKLLKLKFVGIGRFVKQQEIDFQGRDKLIQADGQNKNTGGSSGAGKSTVFHALDYLLDMNDTPATALQSRGSKVGLEVEGLFDVDGTPLRIVRSKKDGLSVYYGEESITGNVKLAEERLEQIIGIPKKLFKKMIHKKQKEGGFFLKMTSGEQYKFLIKVLGLEHWIEKIDKIDQNIKKIKESSQLVQMTITSLNAAVEDTKKSLEMMIPPTAPTTSSVAIEELKHLAEEKKKVIAELEQQQKTALDMVQSEMHEAINKVPCQANKQAVADTSGVDALRADLRDLAAKQVEAEIQIRTAKNSLKNNLDEITQTLYSINSAKKEMVVVTDKIAALKQQKAHIESNQCPTCSQTWVGDAATAKIRGISDELGMLAEKAWGLKTQIDTEVVVHTQDAFIRKQIQDLDFDDTVKKFEDKISALKVKISEEQGKIDNYIKNINLENQLRDTEYKNAVMLVRNQYDEKINTIKFHLINKISQASAEYQAQVGEYKQLEAELVNYLNQKSNYDRSVENFTNSLKEKAQKLQLEQEKEASSLKDIQVAEESKRLIKNYTLQIFQESLDYIGDKATEILSKVPNMANASIYFEGCRETQKGTIKDEVNAILNMDGENDIPVKTLSGGEETSAELAIDFGVIDMIEFKTGKGADFVILDEPFTGLDSINIQNVMDMLIELDTGKKIIIVDHNPEIKAMVSDRILVVREGEESHIAN